MVLQFQLSGLMDIKALGLMQRFDNSSKWNCGLLVGEVLPTDLQLLIDYELRFEVATST